MSVSRSQRLPRGARPRSRRSLDDPLRLGAGRLDRLVALAAGPPPLLLGDPQRARRSRSSAARARSSASLVSPSVVRIEASVASNERCDSVRRERASATIGLGQPEPLGDREGLAAAGQPDRQAVGRRQRLEVELDRGVAHARRRVGVRLELGVVGGRGDQGARPDEVVEQGLGQGRALGRVRAGAELVEQDERARSGRGRRSG